jgi:CDP-diglyceride synthetase
MKKFNLGAFIGMIVFSIVSLLALHMYNEHDKQDNVMYITSIVCALIVGEFIVEIIKPYFDDIKRFFKK